MNAFQKNVPDQTFETLNRHGEFTRLAVSPVLLISIIRLHNFKK